MRLVLLVPLIVASIATQIHCKAESFLATPTSLPAYHLNRTEELLMRAKVRQWATTAECTYLLAPTLAMDQPLLPPLIDGFMYRTRHAPTFLVERMRFESKLLFQVKTIRGRIKQNEGDLDSVKYRQTYITQRRSVRRALKELKASELLLAFDVPEFWQCLKRGATLSVGAPATSVVTITKMDLKYYIETLSSSSSASSNNASSVLKPSPHKDRYASEYAMGIVLRVPSHTSTPSTFVVDRNTRYHDLNIFTGGSAAARQLHSLQHSQSDSSHGLRTFWERSDVLKVESQVGDTVLFQGSKMWHGRLHAPGTALFYVKLNFHGMDPFTNDPIIGPHLGSPTTRFLPPADFSGVVAVSPAAHLRCTEDPVECWTKLVYAKPVFTNEKNDCVAKPGKSEPDALDAMCHTLDQVVVVPLLGVCGLLGLMNGVDSFAKVFETNPRFGVVEREQRFGVDDDSGMVMVWDLLASLWHEKVLLLSWN